MTSKSVTDGRKIPWNVFLSSLAVLVSMFALAFAVRSDNYSRECEFRYMAYDRLIPLARQIDNQLVSISRKLDKLIGLAVTDSDNEKGEVRETSENLLYEHARHSVTATLDVQRQLELNRVSFNSETLSEALRSAKKTQDIYNKFVDEIKDGSDWDGSFVSFIEISKTFWQESFELVNSGIRVNAERIRRICR